MSWEEGRQLTPDGLPPSSDATVAVNRTGGGHPLNKEWTVIDIYMNLGKDADIKVRPGSYPTLQIEDKKGGFFVLNMTGSDEQLRDIRDKIAAYLAEKGQAELAAMSNPDWLDQVG